MQSVPLWCRTGKRHPIRSCPLLCFDNPMKEVLETMVALAEDGMTMIVVTHEMGFARRVADRVVFMDRGANVESGAPDIFFDAPTHERTRSFLSQIVH
jgi:general L-amino acid transport system ATP-binding protein